VSVLSARRPWDPWLLATALVSLLVCGLAARYELELIAPYRMADLGHQLYAYELTSRGKIPYLDFWTNWWGPASFYLNALAFAVLGPSLRSANLLLALSIAVSATALYCVSKRVTPRPLAFAIAATALLWGNLTLNLPYSGWYANLFGLLALVSFARHLESERRGLAWLVATGFLLGLAFSAKQHVGVLDFAAIAVATALGSGVPGRHAAQGAAVRSRASQRLVWLATLGLLTPGSLVFPWLLLSERMRAGLAPDALILLLFVLPLLVVNALAGLAIRHQRRSTREVIDDRAWLSALLVRELVLLGGFALAVAPWLVWFSSRLGWSDFPRLILLMHPLQENFKYAYFAILTDPSFSRTSALFLISLFAVSASIAALFWFATSRQRLCAASVAAGLLGLAFLLLALPIGPALGQRLGFPSDFDSQVFRHYESPELVGPMFYAPLLLAGALLAGLAARGRGAVAALVESRQRILLFALAAFSAYGLLAMLTFVDRAHFQMSLFPWLPLAGFVGLTAYRGLVRRMPEPAFAARGRRAGLLVAVAGLLAVPFVGKPLFILHLQVAWNRSYPEVPSQSGAAPATVLAEIPRPKARGVLVNALLARDLEQILERIESTSSAADSLFGLPSTALFNFLADREFPSKYSYFLFDPLSEAEQRELLEDLVARAPKLYLLDDFHEVSFAGLKELDRFQRDFPRIAGHLQPNYELEAAINRFRLYRLRAAAPR
jgi:hypothetical protein